MRSSNNHYNSIAKFLHWSIALLIIINYITGLTVHDATLFLFHEQIGLTVLLLIIMRIIWNLISSTPRPLPPQFKPKKVKPWQHSFHYCLALTMRLNRLLCNRYILWYVLMLVITLSGILTVNAKAYHLLTFWWFVTLPTLLAPQTKTATHLLVETHIWLSHCLMLIVFIHTLIALIHHYFLKDQLLVRMLPSKR